MEALIGIALWALIPGFVARKEEVFGVTTF